MTDGSSRPDDEAADVPLGRTIKVMRRAAGLTGQQLGARAGMSQAKVSRIETGAIAAEISDIQALGRALNVSPAELQRLVDLAFRADTRMTEWRVSTNDLAEAQGDYGELEAAARVIRGFQPTVVIGLLQTSDYARAIMTIFQDHLSLSQRSASPSTVSEAVSARVRRHEILTAPQKSFRFVLSEAVFSNRLTRPAVMLAQIDRVREVALQDNVELRIVPADAVWSVPPYHGFDVLDDRCVAVDLFNTPLISRVRSDVRLYRHVFDELEQIATPDIEPILARYFDLYLGLITQARTGD